MADTFKDWKPGDPAYSAAMLASNLRAIRADFARLFSTGGRDAITAIVQAGRSLSFTTAGGVTLGPVDLPLAPTDPKGARVAGRRYLAGDTYTEAGSTYVVVTSHVAAALLATDLAAGRALLLAAAGQDAERYVGAYAAGTAYKARDVVFTGSLLLGDYVFWRAFEDVPSGGVAPGAGYPWAYVAARTPPRPSVGVSVIGQIPGGSAILWHAANPTGGSLAVDLAGSALSLIVPARAQLVLPIRRKLGTDTGSAIGTQIGTATFAAGGRQATFSTAAAGAGPVAMAAGDVLILQSASATDGNASGLAGAIVYAY